MTDRFIKLQTYPSEIYTELESKKEEMGLMQCKVDDIVAELSELRCEYEDLKVHNYRVEQENESLRSSLSAAIGKEVFEAWEKNKAREFEKLEVYYQERLQKQEEEQKNLLEEIDKMMIEQENEIHDNKRKREELLNQIKALKTELKNESDEKNVIIYKMNSLNENIASKSINLVCKGVLIQQIINLIES